MNLRKLDALVAEHVMGWAWRQCDQRQGKGTELVNDDGMCGVQQWDGKRPVYISALPEYTTDIAAAWQVVEKLNAEGLYLKRLCKLPNDLWRCDFPNSGIAGAETAPLAIVKAALAAYGVEASDD